MVSVEDAGPGWLLTRGMLTGQFEFGSYCISYCTVLYCVVGLSAENLKMLFKEGVQFNANKLQAGGGSGLGLYITKGKLCLHSSLSIMLGF